MHVVGDPASSAGIEYVWRWTLFCLARRSEPCCSGNAAGNMVSPSLGGVRSVLPGGFFCQFLEPHSKSSVCSVVAMGGRSPATGYPGDCFVGLGLCASVFLDTLEMHVGDMGGDEGPPTYWPGLLFATTLSAFFVQKGFCSV